jgi:hypothetical protein
MSQDALNPDQFQIMRPSYRGKHTHALKPSITGKGMVSVCDTGPNYVESSQIFQGAAEDVTCPQCKKRLT